MSYCGCEVVGGKTRPGADMRVQRVSIKNFRGIRTCEWMPNPGLTCLVGAGDSTKSTVLDAISLCLSARWNVEFGDADFYGGRPDEPIQIELVLTELPSHLLALDNFGLNLRGIDGDGLLTDEPHGVQEALCVRLMVDRSLEPQWYVVPSETGEPVRLSARQREHFGVLRVSDDARLHLRWSRGSALLRLTGDTEELPLILAEAQRHAREAIFDNPEESLSEAAERVAELAVGQQLPTPANSRAGLDPRLQLRSGQLMLHDGLLPAECLGLGSRRLLAVAIQREAGEFDSNVLVVDELEHGLEPHRLRGLIFRLRRIVDGYVPQTFVTTHSPIVLENVRISEVAFVRSSEGVTTVSPIPDGLEDDGLRYQKLARSAPSALLAERVVVGEGATELGLAWALLEIQASPVGANAHSVAAMKAGNTSQAIEKARLLADLRYGAAALVDGDHEFDSAQASDAEAAGVLVVHWPDENDIERQVFADVPSSRLDDYVQLAVDGNNFCSSDPEQSVAAQVLARVEPAVEGKRPSEWLQAGIDEKELRRALGEAASKNKWFKREDLGYGLGSLISDDWGQLADSDLVKGLQKIVSFIEGS